jgi:hypothetical protein
MTHPAYLRALQRSDLSQFVVHLVTADPLEAGNPYGTPPLKLRSILTEGRVRPSKQRHVIRVASSGAACFYDVPLHVLPEVVATNPNTRAPLGLILHKTAIWALGGRPVIYTDRSNPEEWPVTERFRIVHTAIRPRSPIDWMHEREWRIPGELFLYRQFDYRW